MPFFAKCAEGLEDILAYELKLYGISTLQVGSSKVIFDCENDRINELMMKLRTADNIFFIRDFGTTSDSNLKGIRLNKKPLYLRRYRLFNHPSSLLPSVAAALLLCTDMKRDPDLARQHAAGRAGKTGNGLCQPRRAGKRNYPLPAGIDDHRLVHSGCERGKLVPVNQDAAEEKKPCL